MTRVLVVEDEPVFANLVKHALERERGMEVQIIRSGDAAVAAATQAVTDLMVLDLDLPALNSLEVCRILRGKVERP